MISKYMSWMLMILLVLVFGTFLWMSLLKMS